VSTSCSLSARSIESISWICCCFLLSTGSDQYSSARGQAAQNALGSSEIYDGERRVSFPVRFDPERGSKIQSPLPHGPDLGRIPIAFVQNIGLRKYLYGFIGMDDYTLYPMIRPGAFVQIDDEDTKIEPIRARTSLSAQSISSSSGTAMRVLVPTGRQSS